MLIKLLFKLCCLSQLHSFFSQFLKNYLQQNWRGSETRLLGTVKSAARRKRGAVGGSHRAVTWDRRRWRFAPTVSVSSSCGPVSSVSSWASTGRCVYHLACWASSRCFPAASKLQTWHSVNIEIIFPYYKIMVIQRIVMKNKKQNKKK